MTSLPTIGYTPATPTTCSLSFARSNKKPNSVMLFGHNPEFTDLAHRPSSEIINMPTSAVVEFNFDTKAWSDIGKIRPAKVVLNYPKK
jgi:phosphohistidine phosphatase